MKMQKYTAMEAVRAIADVIRQTHHVEWVGTPADGVRYDGPEITHPALTATNVSIADSLTKEDFETADENGVDALEHILTRLYRLGYQRRVLEE